MKKKKYTKPQISVFQIESQAALATSPSPEIHVAQPELYNEDEVESMWGRPDSKTIWSD